FLVPHDHRAEFHSSHGLGNGSVTFAKLCIFWGEIIHLPRIPELNAYYYRHLYFASNISNKILSATLVGFMLKYSILRPSLTASSAIAAPAAVNPFFICCKS